MKGGFCFVPRNNPPTPHPMFNGKPIRNPDGSLMTWDQCKLVAYIGAKIKPNDPVSELIREVFGDFFK